MTFPMAQWFQGHNATVEKNAKQHQNTVVGWVTRTVPSLANVVKINSSIVVSCCWKMNFLLG